MSPGWTFAMLLVAASACHAAEQDGRYLVEVIGGAAKVPAESATGRTTAVPDDAGDGEGLAGASDHDRPNPLVVLDRAVGVWSPTFVCEAPGGLPSGAWMGSLRSARHEAGRWRIEVDILAWSIPKQRNWLKGAAPALIEYALDFAASNDKLDGTWTGVVNGQKCSGTLTGRIAPLSLASRPAPALGEHPRFLFRKEQLADLKRKAQTDWGRPMLKRLEAEGWSRSGTAVARGLLYQLTGERRLADEARLLIDQDMRSGWWRAIGPIHDPAHKAAEAMIAWDLIHDACAPEFNARVRSFLADKMRFMHDYAEINSGNGHPHSNWSAQYRAAVGMIAMGLLADAGALPQSPGDWDFPSVAPPADFKAIDGMPVLPIAEAPLRKWLYTGPLNIGLEHDGLEALGGAAKAWPTSGASFKVKIKENPRQDVVSGKYPQAIHFKNAKPRPTNREVLGDDLQPLTKEAVASFGPVPESILIAKNEYIERGIGSPGMVHLWRAAGLRAFQTLYFFAVLDNPRPQHLLVQLSSGNGDWYYHNSCLYISGRRFNHGDALLLAPGRHPVLRQVTIGSLAEAHGRHHLYDDVWLRPLNETAVEKARQVRNTEARFRRQCIESLRPRFESLGKPDLDALLWQPIARAFMERYATHAIGEHGWHIAGQCYTQHPMLVAQPFAHAFRNATGQELAGQSHLGWFLGQAAMRTVFSDQWARMQDYGRGGGPVGVDLFARGFANAPADIQPQVFWAWQKTLDLTDRKLFKAPEGTVETLDPMSAAFMFVNWPAPAVSPANTTAFPRAIVDKQRLGYTFRNRWQDGNDIVAVFTGFQHAGGDWACEGAKLDLRVIGLGAEWAVRGNGHVGDSLSTVAVEGAPEPDQVKQQHLATAPDGSGVVSLSYKLGTVGTGLRSFAVDYSGASGAPAILALSDKLALAPPRKAPPPRKTGGKASANKGEDLDLPEAGEQSRVQWRWVADVDNTVSAQKDGFTITSPGGAVLRAYFALPTQPDVHVEETVHKMEINYRYDHQVREFKRKLIRVSGGDVYRVVLVMCKGPTPAVSLSAFGQKGEVTVGKQVVRFDDDRVRFPTFTGQGKP